MQRFLNLYWRSVVFVPLVLAAQGCGGRHAVTGRITFPDGTPLDEGLVICESDCGPLVQARGEIQKDGSFRLGMERPGTGMLPGRYRVLIVPRGQTEAECRTTGPIIDRKFEKFEASGLTVEVKGGKTTLNITVTRPPRGRK